MALAVGEAGGRVMVGGHEREPTSAPATAWPRRAHPAEMAVACQPANRTADLNNTLTRATKKHREIKGADAKAVRQRNATQCMPIELLQRSATAREISEAMPNAALQ